MTHSSPADTHAMPAHTRCADTLYAATLVQGLVSEAQAWRTERAELRDALGPILDGANALAASTDPARWHPEGRRRYAALCRSLAQALSAAETIARPYESMTAFWDDAERQARGDSPYTFWDIYEHGSRRRLEQTIARAYGAEDALLVNSGMSALAVAVEAASLRTGDAVHLSPHAYFETTDLVERVLRPRGVRIGDVRPSSTTEQVPQLALLEVADACPGTPQPLDEALDRLLSAGSRVVIDNSLFGPTSNWPRVLGAQERTLFVESTAKFLGRDVMGGVVYGAASAIAPVRAVARGNGQQLQAQAFHHLRPAEITAVPLRLALHRRNVRLLLTMLQPLQDRLEVLTPLRANFHCLGIGEGGCVVFLRAARSSEIDDRALKHRQLLARWREQAMARGQSLAVRAGYGWDETTARCYEGPTLKQAGVEDYLRISVGIENETKILELALSLRQAIEERCHG